MLSRGSEWRKWDLHIHSPASALNNQFPKKDGAADWDAYLSALEGLADIPAIGITDYFSIDGYKEVRKAKQAGRLGNISLILPNIEFRLDKIIDTSKGKRRLNYHVIFSDEVTPEQIEEHFLQEIKFAWDGDPQRTDLSLSVRRENLALVGERLKKEHEKFRDRSDYEIGCTCATVSPTDIKKVLDAKESIFKGRYLIVLPDEHLSLLDWDSQDHLTRKLLLRGADALFSANPSTIKWATGRGALSKKNFIAEFKSLKPSIHGSDAHALDKIGVPDNKRFCWIKANLTFEGLKQILYEPDERVFIGEKPAYLKNDYQVIESVAIENSPEWFGDITAPLNEDLISIIGPRGSGKSALAEAMAFAGGSASFRTGKGLEDAFLSKAAKKSATNQNTVVGTRVTLNWKNGESDKATIPATLANGGTEEKVKYLPQKFVEWLCAPENNQQLEAEIERVVYQRNSKTERLKASNFQELRKATTQPIETRRERLTRTIQSLNTSISEGSARLATKPQKETDLKRRGEDLVRLLKSPPVLPPENAEELKRLEGLENEKQALELKLANLGEQVTILDTIKAKFDVIADDLALFNQEIAELLPKAGFPDPQLFKVGIPTVAPLIDEKRSILTAAANQTRGSSDEVPVKDGPRTLSSVLAEIRLLKERSALTEAKKKEYEKFQQDKQKLEETITAIRREILELDTLVAPKIKADKEARLDRYLDAFELLKEEREVLERLYEPLKEALEKSNDTAKKLKFVSRTAFDVAQHASRGIALLDRRKSVFPDQESLENALGSFFDTIQQENFQREGIKKAVEALLEQFKPSTIRDQLRGDYGPKDFANWFFDVSAFSTVYGLRFDNKDLRFLSPGEKGIVLLLLYLEAEEDDNRPLIIDQPDDNLDNLSVYPNLIEYFRARKKTRQIIIITHNPNLVVTTDSEQVIVASFDGTRTPRIEYRSGALEDNCPAGPVLGIRQEVCRILEGGIEAFQLREARYDLP